MKTLRETWDTGSDLVIICSGIQAISFKAVFNAKMYFSDDIIKMSNKEVLLDMGPFDGDSIQLSLNQTDSKFVQIHGCEMDFC